MSKLSPQEVKRIKNELLNTVYLDDVILGILYFSGDKAFTSDWKAIMETFKKIKETGSETLPQLNKMVFSRGDLFPWSLELERVFFRLGMADIINAQDAITYDRCEWVKGVWNYVETKEIPRLRKNLTSYQMQKLEELGKLFHEEISKYKIRNT